MEIVPSRWQRGVLRTGTQLRAQEEELTTFMSKHAVQAEWEAAAAVRPASCSCASSPAVPLPPTLLWNRNDMCAPTDAAGYDS